MEMDYNVLGGKLNRGLAVIESYKLLKGGSEPSEEEMFLACILGWGIEWLQAYLLVLDDIMDNSHTRRGKPCWYKLPKVCQRIHFIEKVSSTLFIKRSQISRILRHYFFGKRYYVDLLDLFNDVEFQTISGQLLDQITTHGRSKDQNKYTVFVYQRIAEYKTAYYSFYLPVACALLLYGQSLDDYAQVKENLVEMGVYCQAQNDYLDCFGDPTAFGKENYGKYDPGCVAKVKALYKELDFERAFFQYERESYEKLISDIEAQPNETVQTVLKSFLHKIYKRRKWQ